MATGSNIHSYGQWMPEDLHLRRAWLSTLLDQTEATIPKTKDRDVNPVHEFRQLIENDSTLYMLANSMFDEIPTKPPYDRDPTTLKKQVRNYKTMLYLLNTLLTKVPEYFVQPGIPSGLVGFPFNIILDWPMGTASGRQFFLDPRVNKSLKDILNKWGGFLKKTDGGNKALIDAGWSRPEAIKQLEDKANEVTGDNKKFTQLFNVDPRATPENFFNFSCWDAFFTRKFKNGIRPVADSAAVVNACESFPLAFDTDISRRSTFWLKGSPYSLRDILGAKEKGGAADYVDDFVGGAIYQAFLSADSYHCWHAPVTGKVLLKSVLDGTYYAETSASGFGGASGPDPAGPDLSQRYITHVAARGVLIIDTNVEGGAYIGKVAFVPVGMSEVSTCTWEENFANSQGIVEKGHLVGAFHGGGSTHCLIFERAAMNKLIFKPKAQYPEIATVNLGVNSELASVAKEPGLIAERV